MCNSLVFQSVCQSLVYCVVTRGESKNLVCGSPGEREVRDYNRDMGAPLVRRSGAKLSVRFVKKAVGVEAPKAPRGWGVVSEGAMQTNAKRCQY